MIAGAAHLVLMLLDCAILAVLARRGPVGILAALVAAGLAYDTGVLAAGAVTGGGSALMHANAGRYVIHAVLVPALLPIAAVLARPGGRSTFRAAGRVPIATATLLAVALGVLGFAQEVRHLELVPHEAAGLLRYVPAELGGPPVPAIVATLALLIAGVLRWRRGGGAILAVAALCCFAGSAAMNVTDPPVLGSIVETVLLAGIAAALTAQQPRERAREGVAPREGDPEPALSSPQAPDAVPR